MPQLTNAEILARDSARINGVKKHSAGAASTTINSVEYTPTSIIAVYQADLDAAAGVTSARTALVAALAKARPVRAAMEAFDKAYVRCIEGAYGTAPDVLADYGIVLKTPKVKSAKVKAIASVKAEATKAARHIMGTQQRAAIPAAVVAVSLVTTEASATSATTPTTELATAGAANGAATGPTVLPVSPAGTAAGGK